MTKSFTALAIMQLSEAGRVQLDAPVQEVSQLHGVLKISHDGSDFGSDANVIIVPDRQWGVVVMENAETLPTSSSAPTE